MIYVDGGAKETTTVDLSQTYLDWAARNLAANGFAFEVVDKPNRRDRTDEGSARGRRGAAANKLVRDAVPRWVAEARRRHERYDLIFVDSPTFSNSKAMGRRTWDVQRDHVELRVEATSGDVMRMELPCRIDARNMVLLAEMVDLVGRQGKVLVA